MSEQQLAQKAQRFFLYVDGQIRLILRWRGYFVYVVQDECSLLESEQILLHKLHSLIFP